MHPALEFLLFILAIGVLFLAFLIGLHWLRADDTDAGVSLGQDSGRAALRAASEPTLLRLCGWCDGLLHDEPVTLWPRQKVTLTHGICPRCQRAQHAEIDQLTATGAPASEPAWRDRTPKAGLETGAPQYA